MTLQEILKSQGLSDEQIKSVVGEMKQNKIFTSGEENLDIRYNKLKGEHDSKIEELTKANQLIDELKKSNKGNEDLQSKINEYESTIANLNAKLEETQIQSAVKVALLENKAMDIDYLTFKLKGKGELKLDKDGKIKGIDDMIAGLKTQFPNQFETSNNKVIDEHKLEKGEGSKDVITKEQFSKMGYMEKNKLFREQPDVYAELQKSNK